jgi:uncharacterized protein
MKTIFRIILSLLLFFPTIVRGQLQSVFWEISGNGLAHTSYLLGTVHVAPYTILKEFPLILQAMKQTKLTIFENVGETPELVTAATPATYNPPLDSVFTKEEYALVDSFFSKSEFGSIKPHNNNADLLTMAQATILLLHNSKLNMRFDEYLIAYSKDSLKIKSMSLESDAEQQQYKLRTASARQYAEMIVKLIQDANEGKRTSLISENYLRCLKSDLLLNKKGRTYNTVSKRNLLWLNKIEPALKMQSCFIAVGLGHLEYKSGLISLLRKKGYHLKPITL